MAWLLISKSTIQKLAFLVLGILIGSASATMIIGQHIDRLMIINQEQADRIHDLERELAQSKESLSQHQEPVISSLQVKVIFRDPKPLRHEEDAIRLSIEKQVKELLDHFLGMKLEQLEPSLIPWVVENRILEAEGSAFKIKVKVLVIAEKFYIEIEAAELSNQSSKTG